VLRAECQMCSAPNAQMPPGGGERTGRSPSRKQEAKRLDPAGFIGTLAAGVQVGCGIDQRRP